MRRLFLGSVLWLIAVACSKETSVEQNTNIGTAPPGTGAADLGAACKLGSECLSGSCLGGVCRSGCTTSSDCGSGNLCLYEPDSKKQGCSLPKEARCGADADCGPFSCAFDGRCRSRCIDGKACPQQGQYCVEGVCVDKGESGKIAEAIQCIEEKRPPLSCDGATLISCNAPGKPGREVGPTCATAELCQGAVAKNQTSCEAPACQEGDRQCNPTSFTPEACNQGRTGFVAEQGAPACKSLDLCKASLTNPSLDCTKAACAKGETRCFDGNAEACSGGLTGFEPASEACGSKQCNAQLGQCFSLAIDKREVSRGDYHAFLQTPGKPTPPQGCKDNKTLVPGSDDPAATWPEPSAADKDLPVTDVDWCDAFAYCQSRGQYLCGKIGMPGATVPLAEATNPSVNEWLNACASGGEFEFVHGPKYDMTRGCWDSAKSGGTGPLPATQDVDCNSPRQAYKAFEHMMGNVAEWIDACEASADGPQASFGDKCAALGGDFSTQFDKTGCSTGAASPLPRSTRSSKTGFRCCGP